MILFQAHAAQPLPYIAGRDDVVALLLFGCFFATAYVVSRSKKFLLQLVKDFLLHRTRTSIFANSTASDMRYLLLLIVQTAILGGVLLLNIVAVGRPEVLGHISSLALLGIYIGLLLVYIVVKWIVYSFLGWIFFDSEHTNLWLESYSTLLYYLGFALFPFTLLTVYFHLNISLSVIICMFLLIFTKILMLFKWLKLFCVDIYGGLLIFLYFCALEIMPCLVAYQGVMDLNSFLILNK